MPTSVISSVSATLPVPFGAALRFLRKRAHLTQDELGLAVGYSREQIARLENGSRLPDLAVIAAIFVPVLLENWEESLVEQFLALAGRERRGAPAVVAPQQPTRPPQETPAIHAARHLPPAPLLPLIGRTCDQAELLALLRTARLVTIVGAPGIGKTRLALEVAQAACAFFADGAAFISLAGVSQPADIPSAVMNALAIPAAPQQSAAQAVQAYLAALDLLLVLDNCEHLLDGAPLFTDWLERAPRLKVLCTSRAALDLYGEVEWPLAPLAVPDLAQPPDLDLWRQIPAMQLILQRAQAAEPDFALQSENLLPLATLCVALDGLPLALELAAVRLRELSPDVLAQQLLLRRGHVQLSSTWLQQTKRNIAERHRTLQAAIDWSVRLLPSDVQAAFCRLGVFSGGCSEQAALTVADVDQQRLAVLAHANLITYGERRITLLETLRAYALERLAESGEWENSQRAHAACYADFARQVFDGIQGDEQDVWMRHALADHENCQAALRWALAQADGDLAVSLAGSLWWFWYRRGLFDLGRHNLSATLQLPSSDLAARARALNGLASFCLAQEDFPAALAYHQQGLALRRQLADPAGIATSLHNLGLASLMMGDYAAALDLLKQSVEADPTADPTLAWAHMGLIAQELQNLPQAHHWLELAHQRAQSTGEGWAQAFVMNLLADVLREMGDLAAAAPLAEESRRMFTTLEDTYYLPDAEMTLAQLAFDQGNHKQAWTLSQRVLEQYEAREDPAAIAGVLLLQAELACHSGDRQQAAALLARSRHLRQSVRRAISPREQAHYMALERRLT